SNSCEGFDGRTARAAHVEWATSLPRTSVVHRARSGSPRRIGYVSGDFRMHSVAFFIESLLRFRARDTFEVFGYYNNTNKDATTLRLQALCDGWGDINGLSDEAVADKVRADEIDILVDLNGHTSGHRLGVFARRPAPLQVTYLGYCNTTGLSTIDYRI